MSVASFLDVRLSRGLSEQTRELRGITKFVDIFAHSVARTGLRSQPKYKDKNREERELFIFVMLGLFTMKL